MEPYGVPVPHALRFYCESRHSRTIRDEPRPEQQLDKSNSHYTNRLNIDFLKSKTETTRKLGPHTNYDTPFRLSSTLLGLLFWGMFSVAEAAPTGYPTSSNDYTGDAYNSQPMIMLRLLGIPLAFVLLYYFMDNHRHVIQKSTILDFLCLLAGWLWLVLRTMINEPEIAKFAVICIWSFSWSCSMKWRIDGLLYPYQFIFGSIAGGTILTALFHITLLPISTTIIGVNFGPLILSTWSYIFWRFLRWLYGASSNQPQPFSLLQDTGSTLIEPALAASIEMTELPLPTQADMAASPSLMSLVSSCELGVAGSSLDGGMPVAPLEFANDNDKIR